jgi:DNA polymerase III delta subunit
VARKDASRPAAVQLIVGEDSYLAEQALERVLQRAVGQDRADSVSLFYGDESRWEGVLGAARTG